MSKSKMIVLWLVYFVAFAAGLGALMYLPDWGGQAISAEGDRVDDLFWALMWMSVIILAGVMATVVYAAFHFKGSRHNYDEDGADIHGHTGLEIAWTLAFTVVVAIVGWVSYVVLTENEDAIHGDIEAELVVNVEGYQYGFDYIYYMTDDALPGDDPAAAPKAASTTNLVVPNDATIIFNVAGRKFVQKADAAFACAARDPKLECYKPDVIHSFWVPAARIKQDTVPGIAADTQFSTEIERGDLPQHFPVVCAELCGPNHAAMRGEMCVVEPAMFADWHESVREALVEEERAEVEYPCYDDDREVAEMVTVFRVTASGEFGFGFDDYPASIPTTIEDIEELAGHGSEENHSEDGEDHDAGGNEEMMTDGDGDDAESADDEGEES